ncbi:MAG TPA: amidohydrolase family protein [Micromonosporaceae bacterium]
MALLVDGHCHQVLAGDLDRPAFELACTEADLPPPPGMSYLDSQLGLAIRRWCAPVLGLPPHAPIDEYLAARMALGWEQATVALLRAAGFAALLVDTGLDRPHLVSASALGTLAGAPAHEVVRLERVAEGLGGQVDAAGFAHAYQRALTERVRNAIAVKSIIAYRYGLAIPPEPPSPVEVRRAAAGWLRTGGRLTDPVLLRHILSAGVDTGLPLQLHTGFGDRDLTLRTADPALAQPWLATIGRPVILLHCYPYHRQAGWLAQVYPHVYVDIGLTLTHLGTRADVVLAEYLELAPFGKLVFSTDAYLLPELYLVGAAQFRHALSRLLDQWLADGATTITDAERIAEQISAGNARRVYRKLQPYR